MKMHKISKGILVSAAAISVLALPMFSGSQANARARHARHYSTGYYTKRGYWHRYKTGYFTYRGRKPVWHRYKTARSHRAHKTRRARKVRRTRRYRANRHYTSYRKHRAYRYGKCARKYTRRSLANKSAAFQASQQKAKRAKRIQQEIALAKYINNAINQQNALKAEINAKWNSNNNNDNNNNESSNTNNNDDNNSYVNMNNSHTRHAIVIPDMLMKLKLSKKL